MTLWNPLNVFFIPQRWAGNDPSSAFDPSRTGDPLDLGYDRPAIGFGDTRVGAPAGYGDPPRRPIGFAPPEDETTEPRYRTEISFKRHHEAPRASATPDRPEESPQAPWQTPDPVPADTVSELDAPSGDVEESAVAEQKGTLVTEEKVPFYKRELSFRRKRTTPEETPDTVAVGEDEANETAAQVEDQDEAAENIEDLSVPDTTEVVAPVGAPVAETAAEPVAEVLAEQPVEDDLNPVEENVAVADPDQAGDAVEEPSVAEVVEPVEDASAAEELAPAAADDASGLDAPFQDDDLFIEDTPAPKGRFSSRKDKRTEKDPKRKPPRGGKSRRVVGLKIGASQIAAAVVAETDAGHELVQLARRPLPAGIVVDGEVRDADALTNALKAFFDEEKLPKNDVRIGLASNPIGVRTCDIVGAEDEERFDNAVRFKAHEVLPVAVHESVLDYRVLEERTNEAGEPSRRVLLVVAPRDQVEPFVEVAGRAGIKLAGIDLEALGLLRTFVEPKPFAARAVDDTATVVVAIGHESSTLLVAGGGVCEFTRVFDWGGSALEEAIVASLEVHPAEAATILRHLSLSGPGRQFDALDEAARAKALDAVRLRLTPFARELVSSLQFYQTQNESLGIGGIVITGGTSHLEGLGDALHQMIGVNVSVGDPLARVVTARDFDPAIEATIGSMAVPIGLAIDDIAMRSVNLLPRDAVRKKSRRSTVIAIGAPVAAVVPLVALGALYFGAHGTVSTRQSTLDAVQAQIAILPKPQGPTIDPALVGADAQRAVGVANVLGSRIAWEQMFRDVARVLPENVWLDGMTAKAPVPTTPADAATATTAATPVATTTPAAPTDVTITGSTYTQTDVARLLARLATLPSLSNVVLVSSNTQQAKDKKPIVQFNIIAALNTAGGAS